MDTQTVGKPGASRVYDARGLKVMLEDHLARFIRPSAKSAPAVRVTPEICDIPFLSGPDFEFCRPGCGCDRA